MEANLCKAFVSEDISENFHLLDLDFPFTTAVFSL